MNYARCGASLFIFGVAEIITTENNYLRHASITTMSAMAVTPEHNIPFSSSYEWGLADELVKQRRLFKKPLRYDKKYPVFPDFILTDCRDLIPIEVYGFSAPKYLQHKQEKQHYYTFSKIFGKCWDWTPLECKCLAKWLITHPLPVADKK